MAALVQTYSQQTSTATMLQGRTTPTSGMIPASQATQNHQYMGTSNQSPRSAYHGVNGGSAYRGSTVPVQPYAFTTTPNLNQGMQWQQYGAYRTNSSPAVPSVNSLESNQAHRAHRPNVSVTNMALMPSFGVGHSGSRDDSAISQSRNVVPATRSQSSHSATASQAPLSLGGTSSKNVPDRYRRSSGQATQHSRSQSSTVPSSMAVGQVNRLYHAPNGSRSVPNLSATYGSAPGFSMDDAHLYRRPSPDQPQRMRRRSVHTIESPDSPRPVLKSGDVSRTDHGGNGKSSNKGDKSPRIVPMPPVHTRNGSYDSVSSTRSNHSRTPSVTNRNVSGPAGNPSDESSVKNDQAKVMNNTRRGSTSDGAKRTLSPSPLSKPATMANDSTEDSSASAAPAGTSGSPGKNLESPAAKQLAALNQKGGKARSKTSRLRRAFSFGSAAEFRKSAGADGEGVDKLEPSKLHKEPTAEEVYNAEQDRIAEAQEAAGIGSNIYGGRFFGSTDNVSISSTASSASIMIRKMGRGMKRSSRSLVGLFRPRSVSGAPTTEPVVPEASEAAVSMITVEAETQRVNVTADPQPGKSGTGFPRLERNSLDAAQIPEIGSERLGSSGTDNSATRKSILGGDRERAEVLAAVRKGILKRPGSSSPSIRPAESPDLALPCMPAITDSPISSAPSTPNDEAHGHRRTGSIAIGNEDYFMSALRLRQDTKSRPGTPQAGAKRNATFSPRIIFYDTWHSQEYDRRGDVATCNRLTPVLAQQIKEELNSFKMEMEVHENSKIYTHFF